MTCGGFGGVEWSDEVVPLVVVLMRNAKAFGAGPVEHSHGEVPLTVATYGVCVMAVAGPVDHSVDDAEVAGCSHEGRSELSPTVMWCRWMELAEFSGPRRRSRH